MTIVEMELTPEIAAAQDLEEAVHFLDLEPRVSQRLHQPEREIQTNLQLNCDDGSTKMTRAIRVQHSFARGLCMGPLMISKTISPADLRAIAMKSTWQWALWGLPFGGAAAAINCDADELSERELKQLLRTFFRSMQGLPGASADVVTPGSGLPSQVMAWALDRHPDNSFDSLARMTGKPASLQGVDRNHIAGVFVRELVGVVMRNVGAQLAGKHVAVIGFDSQAQSIATEFEKAGCRIIAVSDGSGAIHHHSGINIEMLRRHVANGQVIYGYPEATASTFDELLNEPCDLMIIADGQKLSMKPRARMIVEVNGTCDPSCSRDVMIIPEIVASFGLRFADYLEWRKAINGTLSDFEMKRALRSHVRTCWDDVSNYAKAHEMSLRRAALTLGIARVAEAIRMT